jgi:hypothetical protein
MTPSPVPKPPIVYFPIFIKSGLQIARKFGRGFLVRFLTPMKITVEVAKLTLRPSKEALSFWI